MGPVLTERMQEGEIKFFFTDQKEGPERAMDSHFLSRIKNKSINSSGI